MACGPNMPTTCFCNWSCIGIQSQASFTYCLWLLSHNNGRTEYLQQRPQPSQVAQCKETACQCRRGRFNSWVRKILQSRKQQPTPVFLPGKSHGQRSPVSYSPWGCKKSDMTERLSTAHRHKGKAFMNSERKQKTILKLL